MRGVRDLAKAEQDGTFLMMGNHDIINLIHDAVRCGLPTAMEKKLAQYREVFSELSRYGQFGWIIGFQQTDALERAGLDACVVEWPTIRSTRTMVYCQNIRY